jgi:hypothetical protein
MEEWATWSEVNYYQRDNRLRSSNLQCIPRNSSDLSFYGNFTNDTDHSTLDNRPYYVNQYAREYREYRNNFELRDPNRIIRASKICSHPSQINRFSVSTKEVNFKFTDWIKNNFKVSNTAEEKMAIKIDKGRAKSDLSRFFSLNGKSTVEGGGWRKGGKSVVRYYKSKDYH